MFNAHCVDNNPELVYAKFMTAYHCYDLIPTSSKLVVFDTQLNVSVILFVLVSCQSLVAGVCSLSCDCTHEAYNMHNVLTLTQL